jgi:hypothetical protein
MLQQAYAAYVSICQHTSAYATARLCDSNALWQAAEQQRARCMLHVAGVAHSAMSYYKLLKARAATCSRAATSAAQITALKHAGVIVQQVLGATGEADPNIFFSRDTHSFPPPRCHG